MILLDTHVLIWLLNDDPRNGARANEAIERDWAAGEAAVSVISFWEAALLQERGRVSLPFPVPVLRDFLLRAGLVEIPVDGEIAMRAGTLPNFHRDPADCIIVATALSGHQLVTADQRILDWPGNLVRLDARE